jgi:hypothetical protein
MLLTSKCDVIQQLSFENKIAGAVIAVRCYFPRSRKTKLVQQDITYLYNYALMYILLRSYFVEF